MQNKVVRLLIGKVLHIDQPHTLFAVYRYQSLLVTNPKLEEARILVVPSKNALIPKSGVWSKVMKPEDYFGWETIVKEDIHHEGQLLFQNGHDGGNVGADWSPGAQRLEKDLYLIEEREHIKRGWDSIVQGEWKGYVA